MNAPTVSRRSLLYKTALVAGTAALTACSGGEPSGAGSPSHSHGGADSKGSVTEPLPKPERFRQAPALDDQDLPPVEERLPENPYVVPHRWVEPGNYGGSIYMNSYTSAGAATANSDREFFYGHSPLRWLNECQDIGPGLVEEWETNDDTSEWTLHFRKGLKWSDGEPWTTEDVLFWWNDFVLEQNMALVPPNETRSGKGTLAEFEAVDDTTLKISFDAPAPSVPEGLALSVKGGITGAVWMMPSHYLKQFHPRYADVPDDWDAVGGLMEEKADWHRNPDCPTMIGYRCKEFDNNRGVLLERNPYYWCVMPNGDQLPYVDEIQFSVIADVETAKLQVQQGSVDYAHGPFNQLALSDVRGLRDRAVESGIEVLLWDSGSGTGSIFFFNYDYIDDDIRELIREPRFRQAISHAFDRETVQKSVYFNTGERTTGTLSSKTLELAVNDEARQLFTEWRDSYVAYDPDKAKQLLDELGVTDSDGDGVRELPNGKKLSLRLDYQADESDEHKAKDNQLIADLKEVGLEMTMNPIPPQAYDDQWKTGTLMAHSNWEVGGPPTVLVAPMWVVPTESARWAPLQGEWYTQIGTKAEGTELDLDPWQRHPPKMEAEPGGPVAKLWELYDRAKLEPDEVKRRQLIWDMFKIHISDGPFFMGCVADYPQVIVIKSDLRNVPRRENLALGGLVNPWGYPTPAVYDPECYYWENPDQHS